MLAYSGKGEFVIEEIDLSKIVQEIAQMVRVSVSKKVEFKLNLLKSSLTFIGDSTQI